MSISFWLFFVFAKNIIPYRFIGSFFGAFLKNKPVGQLKNAIADNFPRWRFFVANNISLDLWVIVIFVGVSLDLWVFRYPYGGNR